jgi:ribosome assembly protein 1
MKQP